MERKVIIPASNKHLIIVDGKKYSLRKVTSKDIDGVKHENEYIYEPYLEEKHQRLLKRLINSIKGKTTSEELLSELLKEIPISELERLVNLIDKKPKIKKQKGCLGFKIGKAYLQVID